MNNISKNVLLRRYTGRFLIVFHGFGNYQKVETEAFGKNLTLLDFVLLAWKHLTGEERRWNNPFNEVENWRLIGWFFLENDKKAGEGLAEVKLTNRRIFKSVGGKRDSLNLY